ncbi:MAG TPA: carboxypeptidase-like regulatory domain-containing protein [Pyrinomonadaceae bacterium]|nr:carboxypeptidase-like regulatory domain-containing protein [Pyrinomonadaceae bacterium]
MNKVFILVLLLLCTVAHAQVPTSAPKSSEEPTTGAISGQVVNESGQPVAGASLFVRTVNSGFAARATATDAEGNFHVNGLEPGLYIVSSNAPTYTFAFDPTTPPMYYRIGDSIRLELIRGGVITGTVTNALGDPVIAVNVRAQMVRNPKGETLKSPSLFRQDATDDRGVYRMYGLPPGTYLVSAGSFGFSSSFSPYDLDIPTYAPSSTRDNAAEITVRGGEESTADIRYRGEPGHTVSGTVKLNGTGGATVILLPANGSSTPGGNTFQSPNSRGFAFNGISDGDYDLVAQESIASPTATVPLISLSEPRRVTVKGANVSGLELSTRPLSLLNGRILLESLKVPECQGKRPPLLAETWVRVQRHEKDVEKDQATYQRTFPSTTSPDRNGEFVLRNLLAGRYQFEPRFYARYWYLRSITFGTATAKSPKVDAAANWTAVKSGEQLSNLTITLAEGAASVRGRSVVADPPAGRAVYLLPAEPDKADDVLRYFVADIAADGAFAFNNLPPGRYWALAQSTDPQTATLAKLRQPEAATARVKLRRTPEAQKSEIQLKPCQNLMDYQLNK